MIATKMRDAVGGAGPRPCSKFQPISFSIFGGGTSQTDRQTDRQIHTHTHTHILNIPNYRGGNNTMQIHRSADFYLTLMNGLLSKTVTLFHFIVVSTNVDQSLYYLAHIAS